MLIKYIGDNAKESLFKPIDSTMKKHLWKHVFKIVIGEPVWGIFRDYFETMEDNTRNNNYIIQWLSAAKLEACRKSFKFNGAKVFNSLPHKCQAATSVDDFLEIFEKF